MRSMRWGPLLAMTFGAIFGATYAVPRTTSVAYALPCSQFVQAAGELEQARALVEEARPWAKQADNTELATRDRRTGRQEAYTRLKAARKLYDAYMDAHPAEMEALDSEYCETTTMIYWIKKMASINEFDTVGEIPVELPSTEPDSGGGSSGGGIGGTTRRGDAGGSDDPPPETGEETGKNTADEAAPPEEDPRDALARRARETLAAIEADQRARPGDVPRLHEMYEKFLAEFSDPSFPEYTTAALRLGALSDRMKTIFKDNVGSDPDALKNVDSKEIEQVIPQLGRLMRARDPAERIKGAQLLGACGSGAASIYLVGGIRDDDEGVRQASTDGLVALGGARVANNLVKSYRDSSPEAQLSAVIVLERIAQKGPVDARTMSYFLGRFLLSRDDEIAGRCLDFLTALGPAGGPGLIEGLDSRMILKKIEVIKAIGHSKYLEGSMRLGTFLLQGDVSKTVQCRNAAIEALKEMGTPVIPYLIPNLRDRRVRLWTAHVMNQIAGVRYSANDAKEWRQWCEDNGLGKADE